MSPLTNKIMDRIASYLTAKEGCEVVGRPEYAPKMDSVKMTIQDAFGCRYEVSIKLTGRIDSDPEGFDKYAALVKNTVISMSQSSKA